MVSLSHEKFLLGRFLLPLYASPPEQKTKKHFVHTLHRSAPQIDQAFDVGQNNNWYFGYKIYNQAHEKDTLTSPNQKTRWDSSNMWQSTGNRTATPSTY